MKAFGSIFENVRMISEIVFKNQATFMSGNIIKWKDPPISHSSSSCGTLSGSNYSVPQIVVDKMGIITQTLSTLLCVVTSDELLICW